MQLARGAFVVIEGVDGVGKTEQAKLLVRKLKELGLDCLQAKTPGQFIDNTLVGSSLGPIVRNVLFTDMNKTVCYESQSLLLLADHLQLVEEVVKPAIENKRMVVSDRFMDSQYATWGRSAEDLINQTFSRFYRLTPDVTILLIGNPEECFYRANNRNLDENAKQATKAWSSVDGLRAIQDRYLTLLSNHSSRSVLMIDTSNKSLHQVHELITNRLIEWLRRNHYLNNEYPEI